jgi:uncharacterized protein (TIGR00251 family)
MNGPLPVTTTATGLRVNVRVMPRAPRSGVAGIRGGRLLVRVTAPPVDNAANAAVIEVLARALHLPRHSLRIVTGAASRNKTIEIAGLTEVQLRALLARPAD